MGLLRPAFPESAQRWLSLLPGAAVSDLLRIAWFGRPAELGTATRFDFWETWGRARHRRSACSPPGRSSRSGWRGGRCSGSPGPEDARPERPDRIDTWTARTVLSARCPQPQGSIAGRARPDSTRRVPLPRLLADARPRRSSALRTWPSEPVAVVGLLVWRAGARRGGDADAARGHPALPGDRARCRGRSSACSLCVAARRRGPGVPPAGGGPVRRRRSSCVAALAWGAGGLRDRAHARWVCYVACAAVRPAADRQPRARRVRPSGSRPVLRLHGAELAVAARAWSPSSTAASGTPGGAGGGRGAAALLPRRARRARAPALHDRGPGRARRHARRAR